MNIQIGDSRKLRLHDGRVVEATFIAHRKVDNHENYYFRSLVPHNEKGLSLLLVPVGREPEAGSHWHCRLADEEPAVMSPEAQRDLLMAALINLASAAPRIENQGPALIKALNGAYSAITKCGVRA